MDHKFNKIKEALTPDAPLHTDKEALWTAIEQDLNKDKKERKPVFLIMILTGLGLAVLVLCTLILKQNEGEKKVTPALHQNESSNQSESIFHIETQQQQNVPKGNSTANGIVPTNKNEINPSRIQHVGTTKISHHIDTSTQKKLRPELITSYLNKPQNDALKINELPEKSKTIHADHTEKTSLNIVNTENEISKPSVDAITLSNINNDQGLLFIAHLRAPSFYGIISTRDSKTELSKTNLRFTAPIAERKKIWELQISSGIYLWEKYDQTYDATMEIINQKRNAVAVSKESLTAMVMFKREIKPGWYIGLGLQYNQLTELIQAEDIKTTTKQIMSDSAQYYVGESSVDYFSGLLTQTTRKGYLIYSPNYIKRWNIPLELSYRYSRGKFHIVPSVSFLYNISQRYEGIHIGSNAEYIYKDQQRFAQIYRSSGLMSWAWALDAEYSLTKKLTVRLGIANQNDLNSALREAIMISEKYRQFGLNLGIRMNI